MPSNTFTDSDGDPISYPTIKIVVDGIENDIAEVWDTLEFESDTGKLFGIPNTSGKFIVRIYADDGKGVADLAYVDITIQVVRLGVEPLTLDEVSECGQNGIISENDSHIWMAKDSSVFRYDLFEDNGVFNPKFVPEQPA